MPSDETQPADAVLADAEISDVPGVRGGFEVLVVDAEGALGDRVELALEMAGQTARVRWVEDYLMALGEVATRGPADVVVGRLENGLREEEEMRTTAKALRQLSPHARLLLLVQQADVPGGDLAVRAGFDDYLIEPVDLADLGRAVVGTNGHESHRVGDVREGEAPAEPPFRPDAPTRNAPHAAPMARELSRLGGSLALPSQLQSDEVALFDALLTVQPGLADRAVQLAAARSGIAGLQWSPGSSPDGAAATAVNVPPDHAAVPVASHGETYGVLHAPPPATADALEPWARWLSRWLAVEKRMADLWEMGLQDELTGAWNRRYFNRFLKAILERAASERFRVTLLVFDIDDFKLYNDHYGHGAGDEILRESARLLKSVVRKHDVVARIGGDEFAVIFWDKEGPRKPNSQHPADARHAAHRFQRAILEHKFPKLAHEAPGTLTISGGLASFPWDGQTPDQLLDAADRMAIESKRLGKNVITFGPGALREGES
jgi:diguanylate cyclase (GGDEF)-like protein